VVDETAEKTARSMSEERLRMQQVDHVRHAAIAAWRNHANETIQPVNFISESNGGSGEYKKISLRVTIWLPSTA
jgi:hypothetical protein